MWTRFMDMHSGGGSKEPWAKILIEAPEAEAKVIFYNRFGHNPERVSCTCCGDDYSIDEHVSLEHATAFDRNCRHGYLKPDGTPFFGDPRAELGVSNYLPVREAGWVEHYFEEPDPDRTWGGPYQTLDEYLRRDDVLVIRADEITDDERKGTVPSQGYVWVDE